MIYIYNVRKIREIKYLNSIGLKLSNYTVSFLSLLSISLNQNESNHISFEYVIHDLVPR